MFSWLNFEELLIHNPIELINPSKDTIRVAMSQKQYIEFFSNKYTYNGLYYDENMDFCLFYYADPLQSSKEGDVYAQGYIDVEMKIYRVKWLCNVSISRASGLLQTTDGTQGVPQEGGKYTHTAWSYSADGTDRFTTIYPNLNLLTDSKNFINKDLSGNNQKTSIVAPNSTVLKDGNDTYLNFISTTDNQYWLDAYLVSDWSTTPPPDFVNANILPNTKYTFSFWAKGTGEHTVTSYGNWTIPSNAVITFTLTNEWKYYSFTVTSSATIPVKNVEFFLRSLTTGSEINLKKPKVEPGSTATPWMPSASEVTTADGPSYIGQHTDYTLEDSTNPSSYTWREIQEDKWNVTKMEMVVNNKNKTITTVLTGALAKCTKDKDITGWLNSQPNANYNYRQPQYSLDIGVDDFIISGYGLRGLKNG